MKFKNIILIFCIFAGIILTSGCINFNIYHTKKPETTISSFREYTGEDLDESLNFLNDVMKNYNNGNYSYLYSVSSGEVKKMYTEASYGAAVQKMYDVFGKNISYDIHKAYIKYDKSTNGAKTMYFVIPASFEKNNDAKMEVSLVSPKKSKNFELYLLRFNF